MRGSYTPGGFTGAQIQPPGNIVAPDSVAFEVTDNREASLDAEKVTTRWFPEILLVLLGRK